MFLLRNRSNWSESIRRTAARRPLLFTLLAVMLVGVVVTGSFISVVSASRAKRAAEQSNASTSQKNDSGQATEKAAAPQAQPGLAALRDHSTASAYNHWAALRRFTLASPNAAVLTATKADAIFTDVDGDGKADPGDTLQYTIVVSNTGNADATNTVFTDTLTDTNLQFVAGSVETTPLARPDSYTGLVGNVSITKSAANGVLTNDSDPDGVGPALTVTAGNITSTNGGTGTMNSDGSFTYDPPAGFEGTDTFTYTLNDGEGNTDTGTVSMTISGMVWFIDNTSSCSSNCDGRLSHPFTSLANFQAVNDGVDNVGAHSFHPAASDNIFLYESATAYTGPVTLLSGQKLIGQDATASLSTITGLTPPADSPTFPAMNSGNGTITKITSAGNGINGSTGDNTIRGLTVGSTTGIGINSGASFGTLTVLDVNMDDSPNRTGQALNLTSGALAATFANIKSTNSSGPGITLTSVTGSLTSGSTSITNPGGIGISVGTSSATLNFANTSVTQSGGTGISLLTNTGTITFGTLTITPDANQRGLLATNNTLTITASGGTVTTSGATALEITRSSSTTPLAVSLTSVTANGGTNGIKLTNTSGSFTITGDGASDPANTTRGRTTAKQGGGTITLGSGGTINNTTGPGVSLNNAMNVTLRNLSLTGNSGGVNSGADGINAQTITTMTLDNVLVSGHLGNDGLFGSGVSGLTLQHVDIHTNATTAGTDAPDVWNVRLDNLTGTSSIANSLFRDSLENIFFITNSGTSNLTLTVNNSEFRDTTSLANPANDAFGIINGVNTGDTSVASVTATNCTFRNVKDAGFQYLGNANSSGTVSVTGSTFGSTTGDQNGVDIDIDHQGGMPSLVKALNFDVSGNTTRQAFRANSSVSININMGGNAVSGSTMVGTVKNNIIGNPAVANSGSDLGAGIQINSQGAGTLTATVTGNTVKEVKGVSNSVFFGIANHSSQLNLQIKNNIFTGNASTGFNGLAALDLESTSSGGQCIDMSANTATMPNGAFAGVYVLNGANNGTTKLVGYGGAANDIPALTAFVGSVNTSTNPANNVTRVSGNIQGAANCGVTFPTAPSSGSDTKGESSAGAAGATGDTKTESASQREDILRATRGEAPQQAQFNQKLTQGTLNSVIQAAIERWSQTGISAEDLMRMQAVTFEVTDLPDGELATATPTSVKIDETAAGYGWYLDPTPIDDEEFDVAVPGRELQTTEQSPAFGRMDLLTVVMRELGVAYKHGRKTVIKGLKPLMDSTLSPAVRRLPQSQKITLPTPTVGVTDANQMSSTTSTSAEAGQSSNTSLNHAASRTAGANSPAVPDVNVNIGTLPQGKSITIKFKAQIKSPLTTAAGSVCNQGTVTADGPISVMTTDPGPPTVNGPTCTPLDVADLQLTKTDSPDPVNAGSNITYTLNFKNNGPSAANSVSLSDAVPTNTTFVSVTTPAGWTRTDSVTVGGTGTLTWTKNADAANQETAVFTVVVKVNSNVASGVLINNSATVTSPKTDPDSSNNTATASTTVQTRADLAVTKTDTPDPVTAGNNITYTINYQNNGPSDAQTVQLSDAIPANTTFVSVTTPAGWTRTDSVTVGGTGTITFTKATSVVGDTASWTLVVKVNSSAADGSTITNNATASSATTDPTPGNDTGTATTTVNRQADLELTKTDSPDPVNAGSDLTYTLTLTNHGPSDSSTVVVSDATPANTTLVSVTTPAGWTRTDVVPAGGTGTITFSKSNFANADVATFTIVVNVNANTAHNSTINNSATFTSATTDPTPGNNTGTASTTVINQADLVVTKSDSPDPVNAGSNLTYTIHVVNNGPGSASTVSVSDATPANTTFVSVTTPAGWSRTDATPVGGTGTITFTKSSVANGEMADLVIVVHVNANTAAGTTISNSATATSSNESDNSNNTGTATTTVATSADISVTKTDSPDPVVAGTDLTYTVTITNNGPSDAQSVQLTDSTPTHTTFVSEMQNSGPSFNCTNPTAGNTGTTTCTIATLASGASAVFEIKVHVNANTAAGTTITNDAVGSSTTTDPTPGNNTGTSTTTVGTSADIEVTKTDSPDPVVAGTDLTYTVTITNHGSSDAQSVQLADSTPTHTTFVSEMQNSGPSFNCTNPTAGNTGTTTCTIGTLAAGASAVFEIKVHVNANTAAGTTITNDAVGSSSTTDPTPGNNTGTSTTTVSASADISVTKTDSPDPVTAGGNLTYTITVTNNGPSDAQTLQLSDPLPANTTFVSFTVPAGWSRTDAVPVGGTGTVTATATTLASGASPQFTLVVKVDVNTPHATVLSNTATASATTTDPDNSNNSATATTTVNAQADLSVTKDDLVDPVMLGSNVNYHIVVKNNGAGNALGVVLTDKIPQSVTFISATPSTGSCMQASGTITCNLGDMANGAQETVDVVVKANTVNTVTDTVFVTSSVADPVASNNHDTETTRVVGFRHFGFTDPIITGGCASSVGTLLFTSPAPAGVQIDFPDNSAFVDAIAPVTTVGGETSVQVTANTQITQAERIVNITATSGANSLVGRLKLLPVRIISLTFNPNPVAGGMVTTGTVTLTCPAPKDLLVTLSYDKAVAKPDVTSFTIPLGQTTGQFMITTKKPLVQTVGTITARANGGYLRAGVTVTP